MIASRVKTTILSLILLLSLLGRQGALLLHHPHHEVSRCELVKRKSDRGICHFHESAVKCALCELITQPAPTFLSGLFEFKLVTQWPEADYLSIPPPAPVITFSDAPTLRGPPAA